NLVHGPETYTTPAAEAVPPPPATVPVPEVVEPAVPVAQPAAPAPPAAVAPVTATPPPPEAPAKTIDPLQQEALVEAIQSSISMEVSGQEAPVGARETADQTEEIGQTEDDYSRWLATRAASLSYLNAPASSRPADEEAMGVADWQRPEPVRETEPEPETKQSDNQEDNSKNSHQRALVDRFIKFEPKITPGKADEYMTGNIARASIEEDPEIVSETIADLYVKQGKIDRARKAYRKLMELYPEKSIYFAVRLKNLDKNKK
ncbi:MAG: hypothetical protein JNM00_03230, partial [Flavobacteriales bacterium]|nr:hypothetical protein [Flavobacteriales bacterium]